MKGLSSNHASIVTIKALPTTSPPLPLSNFFRDLDDTIFASVVECFNVNTGATFLSNVQVVSGESVVSVTKAAYMSVTRRRAPEYGNRIWRK